MSLKRLSLQALRAGAEEIRKNNPGLTKEQAFVEFLQTPEGQKHYLFYKIADPEPAGEELDDLVLELAKGLSPDAKEGLRKIIAKCQELLVLR